MYEPDNDQHLTHSFDPAARGLMHAQQEMGGMNLLIRLNFKYILKLLLYWLLPITMISIGSGLASFFYISKYKTKVYTTQAIMVRLGRNEEGPYLYPQVDANTVLETVKIRRNLEKVIDRLDLEMNVRDLYGIIKVRAGNRSDTFYVTTTYKDPELCKDIANTMCEVFIETYSKVFNESAQEVYQYYLSQREKVFQQVSDAEDELKKVKEKLGVIQPDQELEMKMGQLSDAEVAYQEALMKKEELNSKIEDMKKRIADLPEKIQVSETITRESGKEIEMLERELERSLQRYTENNPKIKEMKLKLKQLKKYKQENAQEKEVPDSRTFSLNTIRQDLESQLTSMKNEYVVLDETISKRKKRIEEIRSELKGISNIQEEYMNAKHKVDVSRELLDVIDRRISEVRIAKDSSSHDIGILERAVAPVFPEPTGRKILAIVSTFGTAFFGVVFVLVYAIFSPGVKVPGDLDSMTAVEFIGTLPKKKNSTLTTYFSTLQVVVNKIDQLTSSGTIMVSFSSVKNKEGKSTIMDDITDMKSVTGKRFLILKRVVEEDAKRIIQVPKESIINFQDFREENMDLPEPVRINERVSRLYYIIDSNVSKMNILPEMVENFKNSFSEYDYIFVELFSPKKNYQVSSCIMHSSNYNILVTKYGSNTVSALDKVTKLASAGTDKKVGTVINFGDLSLG
ncbi:GumC family protein [Sedimentisphaera salicampi]|uniref:Tyrosine-protein kinase ptk n=1 Tax=Sedimentisphaera salicampi TaxID=1941349 RepID=A0A1W6LJC3_9BACT|nr:hypothetical protein [Sedimentisphaera salicampi]ARN55855.1 Tyrosine-protein kinase ptk [Sedimentisphaera salicampi]